LDGTEHLHVLVYADLEVLLYPPVGCWVLA
jgi:hypothetical protein